MLRFRRNGPPRAVYSPVVECYVYIGFVSRVLPNMENPGTQNQYNFDIILGREGENRALSPEGESPLMDSPLMEPFGGPGYAAPGLGGASYRGPHVPKRKAVGRSGIHYRGASLMYHGPHALPL